MCLTKIQWSNRNYQATEGMLCARTGERQLAQIASLLWQVERESTVVSHVGGRPFWMKNFKCIFLVSLASLGAERSGKIDFRTPEAQKTEKMLSQMGSYVHFTV